MTEEKAQEEIPEGWHTIEFKGRIVEVFRVLDGTGDWASFNQAMIFVGSTEHMLRKKLDAKEAEEKFESRHIYGNARFVPVTILEKIYDELNTGSPYTRRRKSLVAKARGSGLKSSHVTEQAEIVKVHEI